MTTSMYQHLNDRVIDLVGDNATLRLRLSDMLRIADEYIKRGEISETDHDRIANAKRDLEAIKAKDEQRRALEERNAA